MAAAGHARYVLVDDFFAGGDFFDKFTFWNTSDPTHGFVEYQSYSGAKDWLIHSGPDNARIMIDSESITEGGRPSVRITSRTSYQFGLIVVDIDHMPGGICGTWPAFWTVGPNWPSQGEIDIIEGVNDQRTNDMTLHTGPGCSVSKSDAAFSGILHDTDCTSGSDNNEGCQITTDKPESYGSGFNAVGGGVYATEWTSSAISIFFFPRASVPSDVTRGSPDPSSWGEPLALFRGDCDMGTFFTNQRIVFDTTFCGDWAGEDWSNSPCASPSQQTCESFVAQNPHAFADAYWSVNALKVYQSHGGSRASASISPSCAPGDLLCAPAQPSHTSDPLHTQTSAANASASAAVPSNEVETTTGPARLTRSRTVSQWQSFGSTETHPADPTWFVREQQREKFEVVDAIPASDGL